MFLTAALSFKRDSQPELYPSSGESRCFLFFRFQLKVGHSPAFGPAVDTVTNKVYVSNGSTITVIDGKTNATANVTGAGGGAIAVNSLTNRVYVAGNNTVTVISGAQ